ncbi:MULTISPECIES: GNAT family N-acetyltransferase [unclassified Isoptericola]|uniref:GNAT family N-acetyltransferase n=1 Tax=unclassified Isoptericola TaxID=2623355 RepID=UPI0027128114|nr:MULTISPECIES: GNAT family N-acetyltransferase [unclassified Isoptericola]MDO8144970.1 GNAT family N-acetyltransferase [Isoptericola sp. 178]MDO8148603.1 GNAT family N-acetyltransferase [Isoptericola sp. b515]
MRRAIEVRSADEDDLWVVAEMAATHGPETPNGAGADPRRAREHLSVFVSAGGEVLVAHSERGVVGFLLARPLAPQLYATSPSLYIDAILVDPGARRQGVGRALLSAALRRATDDGAEYVYCAPAPGAREVQRFLARVGFAPAAGHRVVSVAALARWLGQEPAAGPTPALRRDGARTRRDATRAAIEDLVARRRRAREAGLPTGPLDLSAVQEHRSTAPSGPGGAVGPTSHVS